MQLLILDPTLTVPDPLHDELATLRPDWDVTLCASRDEGAELLREIQVDAVVAARMPGAGHGYDLLALAHEVCPSALRVAVADNAAATRAVAGLNLAHRVIARPLSGDRLVRAIESTAQLESLLANESLKRLMHGIGSLPAAPKLYFTVERAVADGTDAAGLSTLIRRDPAVSAKVLQLANSGFYSRGASLSELDSAVVRLGQDTICDLVLASTALGGLTGPDPLAPHRRALLASTLARRLLNDPAEARRAATATVLADVAELLPPSDVMLANDEPGSGGKERAVPLVSAMSAYLLALWGLPGNIVEAVAYRHRPALASAEGFGITGAVHVACALAAGDAVDQAYLVETGMIEHLEKWQGHAEQLGVKPKPARLVAQPSNTMMIA